MDVFSTITSPVFSELVVILGDTEIHHLPLDLTFFETLSTMNQVRPFKLMFLAQVADSPRRRWEEVRQRLTEALDS